MIVAPIVGFLAFARNDRQGSRVAQSTGATISMSSQFSSAVTERVPPTALCDGRKPPRQLFHRSELGLELLSALVEGLEAELPAMKLDAELIDIASNLCALRFVFLETPLHVGQTGLSLRAFNGAVGIFRNDGGLPALLAGESHAGRGTVHD